MSSSKPYKLARRIARAAKQRARGTHVLAPPSTGPQTLLTYEQDERRAVRMERRKRRGVDSRNRV